MFRLDYISCFLTILSTILIGRRMWHGWIVAGVNSALICVIGLRTAQMGFIPANLFCIAIYAFNVAKWKQIPASEGAVSTEAQRESALAASNSVVRVKDASSAGREAPIGDLAELFHWC